MKFAEMSVDEQNTFKEWLAGFIVTGKQIGRAHV